MEHRTPPADFTGLPINLLERSSYRLNVSHYFRQVTISRRRQDPWINRRWLDNQHLSTERHPWNH